MQEERRILNAAALTYNGVRSWLERESGVSAETSEVESLWASLPPADAGDRLSPLACDEAPSLLETLATVADARASSVIGKLK